MTVDSRGIAATDSYTRSDSLRHTPPQRGRGWDCRAHFTAAPRFLKKPLAKWFFRWYNCPVISKSCDWAAFCWFAFQRAGDGGSPVCAANGLSPRSRRLKKKSRAGRVTPLSVWGVSAPEERAVFGKCGWYRGRIAFRPGCGMKGIFYTHKHLSLQEERL